MKTTLHRTSATGKTTSPVARLAESCWFVSSFVLSLLMGPFSALPALLAVFSLQCETAPPLAITH
ncbi:MAG: hypothetical protein ACOY3Z_10900 [Thermodesulfobacteriota bacterium]